MPLQLGFILIPHENNLVNYMRHSKTNMAQEY